MSQNNNSVEPIEFQCLRCGKCCRNLVKPDREAGLMLFPDEIRFFPKENIRPGLGVGRSPRDRRFKVVSYQLTVANCPHFEDNKCSIYEVRPMVCKEYPFKVKYDFQDFSYGLASECTWVHELKKKHPHILGSNFVDTGEIKSGRTLMFKMRDYYVLRDRKAKQWVYSLKTRKWQRNARALAINCS